MSRRHLIDSSSVFVIKGFTVYKHELIYLISLSYTCVLSKLNSQQSFINYLLLLNKENVFVVDKFNIPVFLEECVSNNPFFLCNPLLLPLQAPLQYSYTSNQCLKNQK